MVERARAYDGWARSLRRALQFTALRRGCRSILLRQKQLAVFSTRGSMSRKGDCWDNAVGETLFGSLKVDRLHAMRWANSAHWPSRKNGLAIRNGSPHNPQPRETLNEGDVTIGDPSRSLGPLILTKSSPPYGAGAKC